MKESFPTNLNLEGEESKSLDDPLRESKPKTPEAITDEQKLTQYTETGQTILDSHQKFFETYAQDVSLAFELSDKTPTAHIELDKGLVVLATKWFAEKGLDESQLTWTVCHELEHFRDLAADPQRMLRNFDYITEQAKKTGQIIEKKLADKFGQSDPAFIEQNRKQRPFDPKNPSKTMSPIEMGAYKIHHTFYNALDDIFVNNTVARRASRYEPKEKGGQAIQKLYQETLFKESDYQKLPRHLQFAYSLLRDEMVKGEKCTVSAEVSEALNRKIKFQGKEYTAREIIEKFIKPKGGRSTKAGERYLVIQKTLEPIFNELLAKDIEEWDPQKPEPQSSAGKNSKDQGDSSPESENENQAQESDSQEKPKSDGAFNPFQNDYKDFEENNPDKINPEDLKNWIDKKQADDEAKAEKEAERKKEEGKSAAQKAKEAQEKMDQEWAKDNGVSYETIRSFRQIEAEVDPYLQELSRLWQKIIYGSSRRLERGIEGHFQTGTELDIPKVIEEWPKIEKGKLEETRVMKKITSREVLVKMPDLIRIRLIGDLSGSMDSEKRHVLKQCFLLILASVREFNTYLNQTRSQSKSNLEVDTEAWAFGNAAEKIKPFRRETGSSLNEQRDILNIFSKLDNDLGSTYDNWALEAIQRSITPEDKERIAKKKLMEIVFEITDGGSSNAPASHQALSKLLETGAIARAFQIGNVSPQETMVFNEVWNRNSDERLGEIVGPEIKNLIPAITAVLKEYLGDVQL